MLTDEERKRITQAVYNDKDRGHGYPVTAETLDEAIESIVRAARAQERQQVIDELREFLPEWNYPPHVIAAISLELRDRANHIESSNNG